MGKSHHNRYKEYSIRHNLKHRKTSGNFSIPNSKMKVFTMPNLVFVVVAIAMIANATGCGQWFEKIGKCKQATDVADLLLRCKLIGVPYECSGYCLPEELGCRKWFQQIDRCVKDNDGISCCEEQGVPKECSAYCETA